MGWSLGKENGRAIGYGVVAFCDHPGCGAEIDRGLAYRCGKLNEEDGCGLFFCSEHGGGHLCERCREYAVEMDCDVEFDEEGEVLLPDFESFEPTPDHPLWIRHKLKAPSWAKWREENAEEVEKLKDKIETTLNLDLRGWDEEAEMPDVGIGYADPRA